MKTAVFALFILAFGFCRQTLSTQTPAYRLDLSISPEKGLIEGTVKISVPKDLSAAGKLFLRLDLNNGEAPNPKIFPLLESGGPEGFSAGSARISDLTVNGSPSTARYAAAPLYFTTYNLERMYAEIDLSGAREADAIEVAFHYSARLPHKRGSDDFFFDDKMFSRFSWFPSIVGGGKLDAYELTPFTYTAHLALAAGWDMARIGTAWKRTGGEIEVASSSPVVSLPLVCLKGYKVLSVGWLSDTKSLDVYYRPTAESAAHLVSGYARETLEYYSRRYFPYEASFVSIVQGNPGAYGMAADSLVLAGDGVFGGVDRVLPGLEARILQYMMAHELGHLYWGIGTPADFLSENWLSEGLNDYSTLVYFEGLYGRWNNLFAPQPDIAAVLGDLYISPLWGHSWASKKFYGVSRNAFMGWDVPLDAPITGKIANAQSIIDYDKPYFVLGMLARYCGGDSLDKALSQYAAAYRYRHSSTRELESFLERATGRDLGPFFSAFVSGTKSVDYELSGTVNQPSSAGYRADFRVRDNGDSGIFIPTTITVFTEDGTIHEIPVDAPGEYSYQSDRRVKYAGVDKDAENLDYNRKNNFLPRGIVYAAGPDYWLVDGAADKLYAPYPFIGGEPGSGRLDLGLGMVLADDLRYSVSLAPVVSVPSDPGALSAYGVGLGLAAGFKLTGSLSAALRATYLYPSEIAGIGLGFTQDFMMDVDLGSSFRTYYPVLSLSLGGSLVGLDLTDPASDFLSGYASLTLDLARKSGTLAVLSDDINWLYRSAAVENRVSIDIAQGIPLFRRCLLGFELKGSASSGLLTYFGGSNSALGIDSTGSGPYSYDASALAFLGVPLINSVELQVANTFVLQSLNLALVYEVGTAFNDPAAFTGRLQQSAGIELLPMLRTLGDASIGFAIRAAFDLNAISEAPGAAGSHIPKVSLDLSILPSLFNQAIAY